MWRPPLPLRPQTRLTGAQWCNERAAASARRHLGERRVGCAERSSACARVARACAPGVSPCSWPSSWRSRTAMEIGSRVPPPLPLHTSRGRSRGVLRGDGSGRRSCSALRPRGQGWRRVRHFLGAARRRWTSVRESSHIARSASDSARKAGAKSQDKAAVASLVAEGPRSKGASGRAVEGSSQPWLRAAE